jgi:hypothetical protein
LAGSGLGSVKLAAKLPQRELNEIHALSDKSGRPRSVMFTLTSLSDGLLGNRIC